MSSGEEQTEARNCGSFDQNKNSPGFCFVQFYTLILNEKTFVAEVHSSDRYSINDEPDPSPTWAQ
jgi:hypothetical protein